ELHGCDPGPLPIMLKFILIISKQGQTRLAQYYDERREPAERSSLEADLIRKVLLRGTKGNEVAILEFIHLIVETLDKYFPKVTDLD
ncbi:AP-4 complex subunit sigma-like, partial [Strongylocentrotus purpuratus]|uniref:AP complex mu/sigma subunit domain-containing protein n=1 Tax=Strongylocentrotus purpuratus TaxID=7668 RepID=A0A7M7P0A0_STRPU